MSANTAPAKQLKEMKPKEFFEAEQIKSKFRELLGKRSQGFVTSVLQVVNNNRLLQNADAVSIYNAACMAAILDLPVNQNLGFAWIVPYGGQAQFQMGWKGYVQLAMRTGQYLKINATEIYESQFVSWDSLKEDLILDTTKPESGKIIGYCAYFKMVNGFEKTVYWPFDKVHGHGARYSKAFNSGPWKTHFDDMAKKTVLKQALSKWGYLSIEMQKAMVIDQAVIKDDEGNEVEYTDAIDLTPPDADEVSEAKQVERVKKHISKSVSINHLEQVKDHCTEGELKELYDAKHQELES